MSDFLLVVPPSWTQIDWDAAQAISPDMNTTNVMNWAGTGQLGYIEDFLKQGDLIPTGATVVEAKLIDGSFFMVRLG